MSEFDNVAGFAPAEGAAVAEAAVDQASDLVKEGVKQVEARIKSDSEYAAKRNSRSKDLVVVNTLHSLDDTPILGTESAYEEAVKNNIVTVIPYDSDEDGVVTLDEAKNIIGGTLKMAKPGSTKTYQDPYIEGEPRQKSDGKKNVFRKIVTGPRVVGYMIQNTSNEPFTFESKKWVKDENGQYVGTPYEARLGGGETMAITKEDLFRIGTLEEVNNKLANGIVANKNMNKYKTVEDAMANASFRFATNSEVTQNSPEIQIMIQEVQNVNGVKTKVTKPEYLETFGFLENAPAKKEKAVRGGARKAAGLGISKPEATAEMLRRRFNL